MTLGTKPLLVLSVCAALFASLGAACKKKETAATGSGSEDRKFERQGGRTTPTGYGGSARREGANNVPIGGQKWGRPAAPPAGPVYALA